MTTLTDAAPAVNTPRPRPRRGAAQARWLLRAPLLPALIFTIIVTQVPFLATLVISSLNWNILRPGDQSFAGLSNYAFVFTDERLRVAVLAQADANRFEKRLEQYQRLRPEKVTARLCR